MIFYICDLNPTLPIHSKLWTDGAFAEQFALTEASYVTVRLIQRFDALKNLETDPVVRHNLTLTSCPGTGVKVQLHEARD